MTERIDSLVRELVEKREARDRAKNEHEGAKKAYAAVEESIWEYLDEHSQTTATFEIEGIGKVQIQKRETIRGTIKDPAKAAESIKALGLDDALLGGPSIHQKALSEHVRDWLASGQKIPEGLDYNPTRYVSISRK